VVAATTALGVLSLSVALTAYVRERDPRTVVEQYFAALAAGRAADALALGGIPAGDRSFLTDQVLRAQLDAGQIGGLAIRRVQRPAGGGAVVDVRYQLSVAGADPIEVQDSVPLRRHGLGWMLAASAATVPQLAPSAQLRVALAGAPLPRGPILLLPGALPLGTNADGLAFDRSAAVVTFSGDPAQVVPVITPAGDEAIGAALDAAIARCLADDASMPNCPVAVPGQRVVPGSFSGTATTLPSAAGPDLEVADDPAGSVAARGTFVVDGRWRALNFDNIAAAASGSVTMAYGATVYLVEPIVVVWSAS
jgi:hypothetical protein